MVPEASKLGNLVIFLKLVVQKQEPTTSNTTLIRNFMNPLKFSMDQPGGCESYPTGGHGHWTLDSPFSSCDTFPSLPDQSDFLLKNALVIKSFCN